jgi:hypothetical protein
VVGLHGGEAVDVLDRRAGRMLPIEHVAAGCQDRTSSDGVVIGDQKSAFS